MGWSKMNLLPLKLCLDIYVCVCVSPVEDFRLQLAKT